MTEPAHPEAGANPFPGLRPFRTEEDYLFFGREEQTAELVTLLRRYRFLAVVGTSGSGKSSLVRAGLLPELLGGMMQSAGSAWEVALCRPGGSPIENLARALLAADLYDEEIEDTLPRLLATLSHSARGLIEAYRQSEVEKGSNLLVVIDQFEELFRFQEQDDQRRDTARGFVNLLLEAAAEEGVPLYVVLTMRSDYLGDCSHFPGLAEAVNKGEYLIPRLGRAQVKSAIEGPVGVSGTGIANRLVQHLLNEVGEDQDQLPVLQHALMRTWAAWSENHEEGELIDLRHYESTGGMGEALSRHADEVFGDLPGDRLRTVAEKIFRVLTEKGSDNRGVRRPTRLEKLAAASSATLEEASAVVDAYRAPGVTFLMPGEEQSLRPGRVIDLSHESLMRVWRRLRDWVEDEAQSARVYRRLVDTARLWEAGEAGLYHDPDLGIAQSWREANQPNAAWADLYGGDFDSAFKLLDASHDQAAKEAREREGARRRELEQAKALAEARERSARNFKRFALGMAAVAAVALAAFVFALVKRNEAEEAKGDALKAQISAESAEGAAKASATAARKAREELRLEFARSDQSLAQTFVDGGMTGRAIAHLARTIKPEYLPDNPEAIDRIFSLLAHHSPPRYHAPALDYGEGMHYVNAATTDGSLLATSAWNASEQKGQDVRVWAPGSEEAITLPGYHPWHRTLDFSPNGRFLFVGQTTRKPGLLFDTATRALVREFPQTGIVSARYSVDGKRIITGSHNDRRAMVWNAETGELLFETPTGAFYPSWSPDETRIALGHHRDDAVVVIDTATGNLDELVLAGSLAEGVVAWSPDGRRLLTRTRNDAKLWVWELESDAAEPRTPLFALAHEAEPLGINEPKYINEAAPDIYTIGAFSPDGQLILTAGTDQTVRLWNASDGAPLGIPQPLTPLVGRDWLPLFSIDGERVMLRSRDGRCWVADFDSAAEMVPEFGPAIPLQEGYAYLANRGTLKPLLLPHDDATAAAVVPGARLVLLGSAQGHAARYDTLTGERQGALLRHPGEITAVAVSADGSKLATGSSLGTVMVWDAATSQPLAPVLEFPDPAQGGILGLSFASDGIALTVFDSTGVTSWNATSGERIRRGPPSTEALSGLTSDDGELIVRAIGSQVSVEKRNTGERVCAITHDTAVTVVALSADNSLLATTDRGPRNVVQLWSVATGQPIGPPMAHDSPVLSLAFRSDRTALVAGCARGAHLWSVPAGTSLDRLPIAGAGQCTQAIFSPNGRTLATAFANGSESFAQVWECATGRAVTVPLTTGAGISDLVFLEGGDRLLVWPTRGTDGIAAVWDVSVSGGQSSPAWLPQAAEALGGMKLDDESSPVEVNDRTAKYASIRELPGETRLERFVQWLLEFPGTRSDSPFRPRASDAYLAMLSESTSMALLEEAVRLAPENGRALALRACVRPALGNQSGAQTLSRADLIRARLLIQASDEPLLGWCEAITLERMDDTAASEEAYAKARELAPLQGSALHSVIAIQERFEINERARRHLLGIAIASAEGESQAIRLRAKRFRLAAENGDFEAAREDWKILKELPTPPPDVDFKTLLTTYLSAVEVEADRLVADEDWDAAIALARPAALAAELEKPRTGEPGEDLYWDTTAFLAKLVDWENRDNRQSPLIPMGSVWKFLDDGSDQGLAWRGPDFDESAWEKSGPAPLGYGDGREATPVDFGSDGTDKHITTYFRRRFEVPEEAETKFVYLDLVRDDGAVIYINGQEAGRSHMPPGPVAYNTEASSPQVSGANETRAFRLPIDPGLLRPGSNVMAVEIHQEKPNSSDLNFDLRLVASAYAPVQYLAEKLDGESGQKLFAETAAMIPLPDRETWERDLKFALSPANAEDTKGLPDESWILRYDAQAGSGAWKDALETADRRGSILANDLSPVAQRQTKDWLKRKDLALVRLRSPVAEIEAVQAEIFAAPPRDPSRDPKQIDLTNYFTASLFDDRAWVKAGNRAYHLGNVPETFVPRHGVSFDLRGVVQLDSGTLPDGDTFNSKYGHTYPSEVNGIEIGQKSPEVHFLVACQWGRAEPGTAVARFVMNFADGSSKEKAIHFGDVSDWFLTSSSVRVPPGTVGWHGWIGARDDREVILSELVWKNPNPDQTIESIDFISTLEAAAPFLLGITLKE